jgi:hypothetical protein
MGLTTTEIILWYSAFILELLVCVLAFRRRLYLHLPVFTSYLTLLIAREAFIYSVYHAAGYTSRLAFYSYWVTEAVLLVGRAAAIGELAWRASYPYAGFRVVLKWVLTVVALILVLRAALATMARVSRLPPFVLTLEREIELTAAVVLVLLFALSRRYDVPLQTPQRLVAAGLLVYSLIQVVNNTISQQWLESYFHGWNAVRSASFHAALVIWLIALAKPLTPYPESEQPVDLQPIRDFMRRGTQLIHELSAQLSQLRRKMKK